MISNRERNPADAAVKRATRRRSGAGSPVMREAGSYLSLVAGCIFTAIGFNLFLLPNQIASGGVSGISIILNALLGITPAYAQWAMNIPLFIAGVFVLGKKFGLKTALGSFLLPLFILLSSTVGLQPPTNDPLLGAVYGGLTVGLGIGLVFRGRASTGGLDIAAQILHRFTGIRLGLAVAIFDGAVILAAGLFLSLENALYALIGLFVTSKSVDVVMTGFQTSKAAFIISDHPDKVSQAILHDLDRGLTRLHGEGGYTGRQRPVLLAVVGQSEVVRLKALVRDADPNAFVIISNTAEVLGEGFQIGPLHK